MIKIPLEKFSTLVKTQIPWANVMLEDHTHTRIHTHTHTYALYVFSSEKIFFSS